MRFGDLPHLARFNLPAYPGDKGSFMRTGLQQFARLGPDGAVEAFPFTASTDMEVTNVQHAAPTGWNAAGWFGGEMEVAWW